MLLFCLAALAPAASGVADPTRGNPGREISMPPGQVKDSFFSYLIGIVQHGVDVDIDNDEMRDVLTEFRTTLDVPFDLVRRVSQRTDPVTRERTVCVQFDSGVRIPIPYSLLFYRPGAIVTDPSLVFRVTRGTYRAVGDSDVRSRVCKLTLVRGRLVIDIDNWLEALFRGRLEDASVKTIVLFTWEGEWLGLLQGRGVRTGRVMRSYFNFTRNTILYPVPAAVDRAGRSITQEEER